MAFTEFICLSLTVFHEVLFHFRHIGKNLTVKFKKLITRMIARRDDKSQWFMSYEFKGMHEIYHEFEYVLLHNVLSNENILQSLKLG